MRSVDCESRTANRYVLGALGVRRTVAYPFAFVRDDGLPGMNIERASLKLDPKHAFQDERVFIEIGSLARFRPARRTAHMGDAERLSIGIDAADELVDELRFRAGCGDARGLFDQRGRGGNFGPGMVHPMYFKSAKDRTNGASFFEA